MSPLQSKICLEVYLDPVEGKSALGVCYDEMKDAKNLWL